MMPSKKKKYNARFPPGRIKKIMQTDEEVGKVAQAVPVIISRALEMFVESLLTKTMEITSARNAKTLSPSHMKHCIFSESRFDFLKDLVKSLPDMAGEGEECLNSAAPGRPAVVGHEVSSHAVTEEYDAQDVVENAVVDPTNPVLRVGECHKTYGSIPYPNMNNSPNCESDVTSKLNDFAETGTEGISLPKNTVIKFYPVAEQSGGTVLSMDTSKTSGIAFGNAVDISGVLPITQTIPSFKEQLQPQTSSIALDEDYDD